MLHKSYHTYHLTMQRLIIYNGKCLSFSLNTNISYLLTHMTSIQYWMQVSKQKKILNNS